jgi:mannose PTS system EIID component
MKPIPSGIRRRLLLRSFLVQGSWNYETLIGTGFAFTLIPIFRFLHPNDVAARRAALKRHAGVFNSHPYLAPVAIGAVARLEAEGAEPAMTERFKSAMRGSLGSLGDRLIWTAWRPATLLLGVVLLLAGAAWWVALTAFLVIYNSFQFGLRAWGLRAGLESGIEVGKVLRSVPFDAIVSWVGNAGALLGGTALVLAIAPPGTELALRPLALGVIAAAAGLWLGLRARSVLAPAVGLAWIIAIALGLID